MNSYRDNNARQAGFTLVELMIAMTLGLMVAGVAVLIFVAQRRVYATTNSQAAMQSADNAIAAIIAPAIRGAGFLGCRTLNSSVAASGTGFLNYLGTTATPLTYNLTSAVQGYTTVMPSSIGVNDANAGAWTPTLDTSLNGQVGQGSDVLVLIGAQPGTSPIGITQFTGTRLTLANALPANASPDDPGALMAVSDCSKSAVFYAANGAGSSTVTCSNPTPTGCPGPNISGGTLQFAAGAQLIPLQQTVFFVAQGNGGERALWEGIMAGPPNGAKWTFSPIVPGVVAMRVLYGVGSNAGQPGQTTQYLPADQIAVNNQWPQVTSIKLGFLIQGNLGSVDRPASANAPQYTLFSDTFTVLADSRMRHTYFLTVNTRNTTL